MKLLFTAIIGLLFLGSCTNITVTNQPSKPLKEFPTFMQGNFDFKYPDLIQGMMDAADSTGTGNQITVTINSTEMKMITVDKTSVSTLNDSISVCKVGEDYFLCMGRVPELNILRIKQNGNDLELYPMYSTTEVSSEKLKKYFKKVEVNKDESDEMGTTSYTVTANPKKLAGYFDSEIPDKDPFVLTKK